MGKAHVKTGDTVVVIRGSQAGKRGKVLQVLPKKERAIVEGVNLLKRHQKKSQENPNGAIVEREGSLHISNLMRAERYDERQARKK